MPYYAGQSWIATEPDKVGLTTYSLPVGFAPVDADESVRLDCHIICQSDSVIQIGFMAIPNFPANGSFQLNLL